MKKILIPALLVVPIALSYSGYAQAEELDQELFNLCSRFPLNSRCEGVEVPIPLELRAGEEGACEITSTDPSAEVDMSGKCKIIVVDTAITAYVETGRALDILEGERRSQEVSIPINTINNFIYAEGTRVNAGRLALNTLAFGVFGALNTRPDRISQLEIRFTPSLESTSETLNTLFIEVDRDLGASLRERLEELTGLQAEIPPEENEAENEAENEDENEAENGEDTPEELPESSKYSNLQTNFVNICNKACSGH